MLSHKEVQECPIQLCDIDLSCSTSETGSDGKVSSVQQQLCPSCIFCTFFQTPTKKFACPNLHRIPRPFFIFPGWSGSFSFFLIFLRFLDAQKSFCLAKECRKRWQGALLRWNLFWITLAFTQWCSTFIFSSSLFSQGRTQTSWAEIWAGVKKQLNFYISAASF